MNINKVAGQNIMHATIHIIPRYKGDAIGTKSGIRNVIPKNKN
jgi:diadenosine tetraphosphate (Ap4A) HIT family hydrolase